jgi:hypothetical protein
MTTPLSVRGRILPPDLDDRRWKDLVDEARGLIPKYAPQWTDHNPSDIGITLIELFAHMVEGLAYRLNRVPEKNYIAFLNLLGITRDPATPARAYLTFKAPPGPPVLVAKGKQAQTQGTETEAPIVFETDGALTVLPINMPLALLVRKVVLSKYSNVSKDYTQPPAEGETLTIQPAESVQFCLAFDQPTTAEIRLIVRLSRPIKIIPGVGPQATVDFVYSTGTNAPGAWIPVPVLDDGTEGFTRDGVVHITLPIGWAPQAPPVDWPLVPPNAVADTVPDPYHWIGIRIASTAAVPIKVGVTSILFNSVSAHNALMIPIPESLGTSDGRAFQVFPLVNQPLFKRLETDTPYDHLLVQVGGVPWSPVEDFPAGPGDFYRVDPVAGEISFGNFDPATLVGHGTVPPTGTAITAATYRYVAGGTKGNVGAGTITSMRTPVAGIIGVINLFSAYGGSDEEAIEETKRRAPEALRNRHRAVTAEDYEYLAREATTDVKIVRCLEPRVHLTAGPGWNAGDSWTFAGLVRDPGNVFVIVVPDLGINEPRPEPGIEMLHEVQRFLDRRRDVTTRLLVVGPRYVPIQVNYELNVWKDAVDAGIDPNTVKANVEDAIELFLHPINGNNGRGWQVGQHVHAAEIFRAVNPPEEHGYISRLDVEPLAPYPPYHDPPLGPGAPWLLSHRPFVLPLGAPSAFMRLTDYELACFGSAHITNIGGLPTVVP